MLKQQCDCCGGCEVVYDCVWGGRTDGRTDGGDERWQYGAPMAKKSKKWKYPISNEMDQIFFFWAQQQMNYYA